MNNTAYTYNERPVWSETVTQIDSYSEPTLSIGQNIFFIVQLKNKEVYLIIKDEEEQINYTYKRDS